MGQHHRTRRSRKSSILHEYEFSRGTLFYRIQSFEFDAGIVGGESSVDAGLRFVSVVLQGRLKPALDQAFAKVLHGRAAEHKPR